MSSEATWKGLDRERDLPLLGVDPEGWKNWNPDFSNLDDKRDNRDPQEVGAEIRSKKNGVAA